MRELTQEYLQELFDYKDGCLYWKNDRNTVKVKNKRAGYVHTQTGYRRLSINHYPYLEHRIIFLHQFGYLPKCLDHKDGNRENNNIENLRPATYVENMHNRKLNKDNKSGIKGVWYVPSRQSWRARIRSKNLLVFCKYYKTLEEAEKGIKQARAELHKEFARHE
jgi:hypothetical protein